jgi:hypothetical protein
MEEQILLSALQKLIESGALDKLNQPGAQSAIIYALLILLAGMVLKYIVFNGLVKKFFDLEELKVKELQALNSRVIELQQDVKDERNRLINVMNLLQARREGDLQ